MRTILCLLLVVCAVNAAMIPRDIDAASMVNAKVSARFFQRLDLCRWQVWVFWLKFFFLDNFQFF